MSSEDPAFSNTEVDEKFVKFIKFIKEFDREYRNMEELQIRYKIFLESLDKIDELNNAPGQTATFGINQFADKTEHEKKRNFGLCRKPKQNEEKQETKE